MPVLREIERMPSQDSAWKNQWFVAPPDGPTPVSADGIPEKPCGIKGSNSTRAT
jgi:hypothetical protein